MKPLDEFAADLATKILASCGCWSDAFPSRVCAQEISLCALQIESGVTHDKPAKELAHEILVARCACYAALHDDFDEGNATICARDLRKAAETLQAAFDLRSTEIATIGAATVASALG